MSVVDRKNEGITTREFVEKIFTFCGRPAYAAEAMDAAGKEGWIDAQQLAEAEEILTRRSAAMILHRFLKLVLGEKDEEDISPAEKLKDLYDCRVCVGHIAQMYVKGVMEGIEFPAGAGRAGPTEGKSFWIFDGTGLVGRRDAERDIVRALQRSERTDVKKENKIF